MCNIHGVSCFSAFLLALNDVVVLRTTFCTEWRRWKSYPATAHTSDMYYINIISSYMHLINTRFCCIRIESHYMHKLYLRKLLWYVIFLALYVIASHLTGLGNFFVAFLFGLFYLFDFISDAYQSTRDISDIVVISHLRCHSMALKIVYLRSTATLIIPL